MLLELHFDGSCWPNPKGKAGYGYTIAHSGEIIDEAAVNLGTHDHHSNNYAEFMGLAAGLESCLYRIQARKDPKDLIYVYGDSQLVINFMSKGWRGDKSKLYYPALIKARKLDNMLKTMNVTIVYSWIEREKNTRCDELSKKY